MRTPPVDGDPTVHAALLAHASDLTVIGTVLRPHAGLGEADSPDRIRTAVTSHSLWLHADFRVDDWLLVSQESPRAAGARGFGIGQVFTRDGVLVASFAQESLIRPVA
jgi:acyl-CoA thioesterase-2